MCGVDMHRADIGTADMCATFSKATVAICGLGGLGSHIATALARAGVGHLILIDFDRVDASNLHRQQYKQAQIGIYKTEALADNLREIDPAITLTIQTVRVTEENCQRLLQEADVICEAFDDPEAKAMLVNGVLETMPDKYLVAGSGMAGLGPGNTIRTRRVMRRLYVCGDGVSAVGEVSDVGDMDAHSPVNHEPICGVVKLMAPRVMLCASHQALTVLRILAGEYDV